MIRLWYAAYSLFLHLLVPAALAHLWLRGRRQPEYRAHVGERFGRYGPRPFGGLIWIHAVSVGETRASQPLVAALMREYPQHRLLFTHTTPTGRETGEQLFGDRVSRVYLPYDLPWAVERFLDTFEPEFGLLMETELWPNLARSAARRRIALYLVNARMSEKSARGYGRLATLTRETLRKLTAVAAQTHSDAQRLTHLGARDVLVTGNLKFDVTPPPASAETGKVLRTLFGTDRPVWMAASTREGEEALVLDALEQMERTAALLVLVPRHPQRFEEVATLLASRGIAFQRRSAAEAVRPETRVVLGDSMGELFAYYHAADVAFIGGSLLPLGGQNLIEACAVGVPVLIGPHTFNFADATRLAIKAGAAVTVPDPVRLAAEVQRLLGDRASREEMAAAGLRFASEHRGATDRVIALIAQTRPRPR